MADSDSNTETLSIKFDVDDNRADAKAVATTMLAVKAIVDEVKISCSKNESILLKARPFSKGSLEVYIDFVIAGSVLLLQDYPFFQKVKDVIRQYFNLKGLISGGTYSVQNGNIIIIKGNKIQVDDLVLKCLDPSGEVDRASVEAFKAMEDDVLIKSVKIQSNTSVEPLVYVMREKFPEYYQQCFEEQDGVHDEKSEMIEAELIVRQPAFDRDLVWKFIHKGIKINARVVCEKFQEKIDAGEEFASGDKLNVTLKVKSFYDVKAKVYVVKDYEVLSVHQHNKRRDEHDDQMTLF